MASMTDTEDLSERVSLATSKAQIRRIDDWRRKQEDLPTRAEAMRHLIERGLASDAVEGNRL